MKTLIHLDRPHLLGSNLTQPHLCVSVCAQNGKNVGSLGIAQLCRLVSVTLVEKLPSEVRLEGEEE